MKKPRRRILRAKPGQLVAYYGYDKDGNGPDLCVAWGGNGAGSSDGRCLIEALSTKVFGGDLPFFKELEARGYDLSTLKFIATQRSAEA